MPKVKASRDPAGGMQPRENFRILATKSHVSWVSEKFRQDICQILTSKVLFSFIENMYSVFRKNLTDFRKTMESCLDPAVDLQDSVSQNFKTLSRVNRSHTSIADFDGKWNRILIRLGVGTFSEGPDGLPPQGNDFTCFVLPKVRRALRVTNNF